MILEEIDRLAQRAGAAILRKENSFYRAAGFRDNPKLQAVTASECREEFTVGYKCLSPFSPIITIWELLGGGEAECGCEILWREDPCRIYGQQNARSSLIKVDRHVGCMPSGEIARRRKSPSASQNYSTKKARLAKEFGITI